MQCRDGKVRSGSQSQIGRAKQTLECLSESDVGRVGKGDVGAADVIAVELRRVPRVCLRARAEYEALAGLAAGRSWLG